MLCTDQLGITDVSLTLSLALFKLCRLTGAGAGLFAVTAVVPARLLPPFVTVGPFCKGKRMFIPAHSHKSAADRQTHIEFRLCCWLDAAAFLSLHGGHCERVSGEKSSSLTVLRS